ncbi:glycosyltransferase family 2 protein [Mesorhizobium sp. ZMM04-5]|uniref:Glycosyltransferase family 2 protein n=1 Tax=Mesorhizobium marinum TaxID=3228790 RepID=A0ABV3R0P7_9HYPH
MNRNVARISICIAASDRVELLIGRCLPSILQQTEQDFEVCIVGDFIEERNVRKILDVADPRIVFENLPRRGPYPRPGVARWQVAGTNAMNAALLHATGEYICHIDDDDEMAPDKLELCLAKCLTEEYDFVHHAFFSQLPNRQWVRLGDGRFRLGQITTGSVFYHRRHKQVGWDVEAFKRGNPGDWDRFSRIKTKMNPKIGFVNRPLLWHYKENNYPTFVPKPSEVFLET